jgi:acyl carrier protein
MHALKLDGDKYDEISMDTDFEKDLGTDSLDAMEIVMAIEDMHGIDEIPEAEATKAKKIGNIYDYVIKHYKKDISNIIDFQKSEHYHEKLIKKIEESFKIPSDKLKECKNMSELVKEVQSLVKHDNE